jgi:hypothetical protein
VVVGVKDAIKEIKIGLGRESRTSIDVQGGQKGVLSPVCCFKDLLCFDIRVHQTHLH